MTVLSNSYIATTGVKQRCEFTVGDKRKSDTNSSKRRPRWAIYYFLKKLFMPPNIFKASTYFDKRRALLLTELPKRTYLVKKRMSANTCAFQITFSVNKPVIPLLSNAVQEFSLPFFCRSFSYPTTKEIRFFFGAPTRPSLFRRSFSDPIPSNLQSILLTVQNKRKSMEDTSLEMSTKPKPTRSASESSDDFIFFCNSDRLPNSDQESSENSSDESDCSVTSDDCGWTSDCDQLCRLLAESNQIKPTDSANGYLAPTGNPCRNFETFPTKTTSSPDISRFTQGVDLSFNDFTESSDSSDEGVVFSSDVYKDFIRPISQKKSAVSRPCLKEEEDSGTSSMSNQSDEDQLNAAVAASLSSNCVRKQISCPEQLKLTDQDSISNKCSSTVDKDYFYILQSTLNPCADVGRESDWESDTESDDVETHYPSRSSISRAQAAASCSPFNEYLPANEFDYSINDESQQCNCEDKSILKCSHCVNTRKRSKKSTHKRTVWFPGSNDITTTHYLDDSSDEVPTSDLSGNPMSAIYATSSRKSPWELMARDRSRFQRRIALTERKISPVLNEKHREQVFSKLTINQMS